MPILNQICGYLVDVVTLTGAKAVEIVTCVGQAGVEVVKKIALLS